MLEEGLMGNVHRENQKRNAVIHIMFEKKKSLKQNVNSYIPVWQRKKFPLFLQSFLGILFIPVYTFLRV